MNKRIVHDKPLRHTKNGLENLDRARTLRVHLIVLFQHLLNVRMYPQLFLVRSRPIVSDSMDPGAEPLVLDTNVWNALLSTKPHGRRLAAFPDHREAGRFVVDVS